MDAADSPMPQILAHPVAPDVWSYVKSICSNVRQAFPRWYLCSLKLESDWTLCLAEEGKLFWILLESFPHLQMNWTRPILIHIKITTIMFIVQCRGCLSLLERSGGTTDPRLPRGKNILLLRTTRAGDAENNNVDTTSETSYSVKHAWHRNSTFLLFFPFCFFSHLFAPFFLSFNLFSSGFPASSTLSSCAMMESGRWTKHDL